MRRWSNWFGLRCWLRGCFFEYYETEHGCGGRCPDCGRVIGWMNRAELRAVADRIIERRGYD